MLKFVCSLAKGRCLLPLLALVLLCGCASQTSQTSQTPISTSTAQAAPTSTPTTQAVPTSTPTAQPVDFTPYIGKWEVHGSLLTINANYTGLAQWNAGPCQTAMCNGNANITFTQNADGSITGTIQSVSYTQWSGGPAPSGYQPDPSDPQAGDTFQLQRSGAHLLYTTWLGALSSLNSGNRYWCDSYAVKAGWKQCGA